MVGNVDFYQKKQNMVCVDVHYTAYFDNIFSWCTMVVSGWRIKGYLKLSLTTQSDNEHGILINKREL